MSSVTQLVTTVCLCDAAGHMIWTSSTNPEYKVGPLIWEYAADEDRELCKNAISRAVVLREPQEFDAGTRIGEHYHCWAWPLNSPDLAVCLLAVLVPKELTKVTPREKEALTLLAQGHSTSEIARLLDVSVSTIHTHFRRVRKKLKLRSVEALIGFAARYCYPPSMPLSTAPAFAAPKHSRRSGRSAS